jgi:flagellar assembly protein FliH
MSSSPDRSKGRAADAPVLRGEGAREIAAASFDVDLRSARPLPSALVAQARDAARTAGYADGWAQGQRAAKVAAQAVADQVAAAERAAVQQRTAAAEQAVAAVAQAAANLDARRTTTLAELGDAVLSAAVEVAEAILGYEVSRAEDSGLAAARRALAMVPECAAVTVRLNPDDHRALAADGGTTYAVDGREITLRADAALARGDAVAEYGVTTVDATLANALARVREVLAR